MRDVSRRQTECARLVLVDVDAQHTDGIVPVELDVTQQRTRGHDALNVACDRANDLGVGPDDAKLHRVSHRRTELQPRDPDPRLREGLVCGGHQARAHPLARLEIASHHDELRHSPGSATRD